MNSVQKQEQEVRKVDADDNGKSIAFDLPQIMLNLPAAGIIILHQMGSCVVEKHPDKTVVKKGMRTKLDERAALDFAAQLNIPVPRVHEVFGGGHERVSIRMDFVEGKSLDKAWPKMTGDEKDSICLQLREILEAMRSAPWTNGLIGSCSGGKAQDLRQYTKYEGGPFSDEAAFNEFYLDLVHTTPSPFLAVLRRNIRKDYRIVFTHGDLGQQNILVKDGRITGLIDWKTAGWYPEHWEYIKFFDRHSPNRDWKDRIDQIFTETYDEELILHQAIVRWQRP